MGGLNNRMDEKEAQFNKLEGKAMKSTHIEHQNEKELKQGRTP